MKTHEGGERHKKRGAAVGEGRRREEIAVRILRILLQAMKMHEGGERHKKRVAAAKAALDAEAIVNDSPE